MTPSSILREVFGYEAFRGPQADIVGHVTGGGDALVLMPTGGGKSLCYQIPAIARQQAGHGVAIVVSPLIALMHDQVGALHEAGVEAAFLNSTLDWQEAQEVEFRLQTGAITLLYVAPERLNTPRFLGLLGMNAEAVLGQPHANLLTDAERGGAAWRRMREELARDAVATARLRHLARDGRELLLELCCCPTKARSLCTAVWRL